MPCPEVAQGSRALWSIFLHAAVSVHVLMYLLMALALRRKAHMLTIHDKMGPDYKAHYAG